jgi:tetratricopeptide (TPR) repeat protein
MRKYFLILPIIFFLPFITKAQMPELSVDGKTNNGVRLQALKIEVKVCGTVARTTWQMTFKNTTSRILEGSLNFPLKEGMSVSRYALDINGRLREAVPVDRSKGTEVFETIERRKVDPGLLEKVDGNTFRTRIYPINPNATRTVLIGYEEELTIAGDAALHYYLPLNLKDTVSEFDLNLSVIQNAIAPVFDSSLNENIQFNNSNNKYTAAIHKLNYVPGYALSFAIPKPVDAAEVMLQEFENNYYFLINTRLQNKAREKILPGTIGLLWDASLSGAGRDLKKEIELLDAYFKKLNNTTVSLVVFSNTIKNSPTYTIQNGNWDELKKYLQSVIYDGATDPGNLNLKNIKADEFILVSDGHQTLGNKQMQLSNKPVYCINSTAGADYSNLKFITGKTGGLLIELQNETIASALNKLINEPLRFLGIKQNDLVKEHYPSIPVEVNNNFAAAGIAAQGIEEIVLQFGYGNTVTMEKTIHINAETQLCEDFDITKIFAQKKIAELDIQYNQNRPEIEKLGKQFGIVTRNTSLIVLETISDYIQYEIEPPAELREEYNRIMKQRNSMVITKKEAELENSLQMIATLKDWYNGTGIDKKRIVKTSPVAATRPAETSNTARQQRQSNGLRPSPTGNTTIFSGRITDDNGSPIPFVTVNVKGSRTGVAADANGNYRISAKQGDVLRLSAAGFNTTEYRTGRAIVVNNVMRKSNDLLEAVVVTGGYSAKRTLRTTSSNTQVISDDQLNSIRSTNINDALAGKVSGVQLRGQSGAKLSSTGAIRLHGATALPNNPGLLYVLNGERVSPNNINTNAADSVYFLEGPAASAIFGPDAANGAMVMTTKNFKPNKTEDKVEETNKTNEPGQPYFDIETFDYLKTIRQTQKENRYAKYLEMRQYYNARPTYFFEVASYLLKTGDKTNGLTILTNLAELENGSYELYKMLGYKLKEAGEYEGELSAFKKVLELRPSDPQSFRDCALAYLDLGKYQQALDMLYEGMTKSYSAEMNRMYNGIEEIFLTEINRIIALHKKELNLKKIDKQIIAPMPSDIRVVMNWNKNNSDIDLWVTDPNGEKCFYSHKLTAMGGRISDDFTEGFGPEQFMLKTGSKGKYKIQINYYSDRQVTIAGLTTVMAEVYLHYGMPNEEKKIITLQMQKDKQGEVFIGEVEL